METCLLPIDLTVDVVVKSVCLLYKSVQHLTVCTKLIIAARQITEGCPCIVRTCYALTLSIYEIVISVNLMETCLLPIDLTVDVVVKSVCLLYKSVQHLTVCTKLVITARQITESLPCVISTCYALTRRTYEVVISINLMEACLLPIKLTILIVINAIAHLNKAVNHLTVRSKCIGITRQIALGLPYVISSSYNCRTVIRQEIIIAIYIMETHLLNAVYNIVKFAINIMDSIFKRLSNSIFTEVIPLTEIVEFLIVYN